MLHAYSKTLSNVVEESLFCTSQGSEARVCRWGGHSYIYTRGRPL